MNIKKNVIEILLVQAKDLFYGQLYDEAIEIFDEIINRDPYNADAYYYRGLSFANKGNRNKSIEDCNKALEIDPNYPVPIYIRV